MGNLGPASAASILGGEAVSAVLVQGLPVILGYSLGFFFPSYRDYSVLA